ncbi:MAG: competence protein ComEC [Sphingobacteriales bacterium]
MHPFQKTPFVRLVLTLIIGIFISAKILSLYPSISESLFTYFILSSICCITCLLILQFNKRFSFKSLNGGVITIFLLLVSYSLVYLNSDIYAKKHYSQVLKNDSYNNLEVTILASPEKRKKSYKWLVEVTKANQDSNWYSTRGKLLIYSDTIQDDLKAGDRVVLKARINKVKGPQNPFEFNYQSYLHNKQIHHQTYLKFYESVYKVEKGGFNILAFSNNLQNKLSTILSKYVNEPKEFGVASALVLGDKKFIDDETQTVYGNVGAMHVLAVSGLHVGFVFLILSQVFFFLNYSSKTKILKVIIVLLGIWFYALITGLSPSVCRAATMFSFFALGDAFNKQSNTYNLLAASAFLLLLINPFLLFEVGFQLSYLAVLGIITLQPPIANFWKPNNIILDKIWQLTAVSIAAQIATFPLGLYYFHQFPTYFLLANLVVIPVAMISLFTGIALLVFSPIEVIATLLGKILSFVLGALKNSLQLLENLPLTSINQLNIDITTLLFLYIIITIGAILVYKFTARRFILIMASVVTFLIIQTALNWSNKVSQTLVIHSLENGSAINVINGPNAIFYTNVEQDKLAYGVEPLWQNMGIKNIQNHNLDVEKSVTQLSIEGSIFTVINNDLDILPDSILNSEVVLIRNNSKLDLIALKKAIKFNLVVIDGSNNYYFAEKIEQLCSKLDLNTHNTYSKGAYVQQLN